MAEVSLFLQKLDALCLDKNKEDSLRWVGNRDAIYTVNSFYRMLQKQSGDFDATWPWKMIWKSLAQSGLFWMAGITWGVFDPRESAEERF